MLRRIAHGLVSAVLASTAWSYFGGAAVASDYRISNPVVYDNLAVYFIHGSTNTGPSPLTLEQATASGDVKIYGAAGVMIENVSNQSVFIQLGDLLKGGLQDQVAGTSFILPPRSGRVPIDTFCVDPFRSTPRDGESPNGFRATSALFPSRSAKLSIFAGAEGSTAVRGIRQLGIWWSIDSLRSQLSRSLNEPLEPPRAVHWSTNQNSLLAGRESQWTTSLPLALENLRLAQAQKPYINALNSKNDAGDNIKASQDIIGAAFIINGKLDGADIYHSHSLFLQIWPKLLRAYTTAAIAAKDSIPYEALSFAAVNEFFNAARANQTRERTLGGPAIVSESDVAFYTETSAPDGSWIYRSYVPKLNPAMATFTPDGILVQMLETGEVNGGSIASLGNNKIILQKDASKDRWSASIQAPQPAQVRYASPLIYASQLPQHEWDSLLQLPLDRHLARYGVLTNVDAFAAVAALIGGEFMAVLFLLQLRGRIRRRVMLQLRRRMMQENTSAFPYGGGRMMKAAAAMSVSKDNSIIRRPVIIRIIGSLTASNIAAIVSHHCDKVRKLAFAVQRPVFAPVKRRRAQQRWEQRAA
jgi:cytoskeletal protein CcmA (bactofilin family)